MLALDEGNPQVRRLVQTGFRLSYHEHRKANGRVVVTFGATDKPHGIHLQGSSSDGDASSALSKLVAKLDTLHR